MCLSVPGRVVSVLDEGAFARNGSVDFGGVVRRTNLTLVPEAQLGDWVLVHAGIAISCIDEAQAGRVFEYLRSAAEPGGGRP